MADRKYKINYRYKEDENTVKKEELFYKICTLLIQASIKNKNEQEKEMLLASIEESIDTSPLK